MKRLLIGLLTVLISVPAHAAEPIKIGDIYSYTKWASYGYQHKRGQTLAVKEINAHGGVLGRPLEIVSRDDQGKPDEAIRIANELLNDATITSVVSGLASHVGLATSQVCKEFKTPCIMAYSSTDKLLWDNGHDYIFRLVPSTTVYARILAEKAAKLPVKRWTIVAPQYEFGEVIDQTFRAELKRLRPDVKIANTLWAPLGKLKAGPTITAVAETKPDALFVALVSTDLAAFVREGIKRNVFQNLPVVAVFGGFRQDIGGLVDEMPLGWTTMGYDPSQPQMKDHDTFIKAFEKQYNEQPDEAAVLAYTQIYALKTAIEKAKNPDRQSIRDALEGLTFPSPWGEVHFRKLDHQSSMGRWLGITAKDDQGKTVLRDWHYVPSEPYWPRADDKIPANLKRGK